MGYGDLDKNGLNYVLRIFGHRMGDDKLGG